MLHPLIFLLMFWFQICKEMAIFFVLFSVAEEIYLCTSQTAAVLLSLLMIVFKV